ncbi:MAG: selenide, water dikinase SelD [Bacteroidota bacterium]|nr:selenide, water dikinase SelD [Bacteroidota bacterium]
MKTIYLDYNATTPVDKAVAEAIRPYLSGFFGNPSSLHEEGILARKAVENARKQLAEMLGSHPDEIIFTSGGTESNNTAIMGIAFAQKGKGNHIITSSIEHPAVMEVCKFLEKEGFTITWLPVDEYGMVNPSDVEQAITPATVLISVMHANNETGTIQPIPDIGEIARKHGIPFHTDAAQSCGKIPVKVDELKVDLLSVAGHKLYAPKGVGALYIRRGTRIEKILHGANHEQNIRPGTENVMEIVGLGKAAEIASEILEKHPGLPEQVRLRDRLLDGIQAGIPEARLNGHPEQRLPNTCNISFPRIEANLLLENMKGIAASAGAACHSGDEVVSTVLSAMKVPDIYAIGSIRFSVGRMTTEEEIDKALKIILKSYKMLKGEDTSTPEDQEIRLTRTTHGLGCACKLRPQILEQVLKDMPVSENSDVIVGLQTSDDASVYRISEDKAIVQTIDFISPVVDDPYEFGGVSAANALSDIYAMGGNPLYALSVVAFPDKLLPLNILKKILKGATDKVQEAGIPILGGHTIEDTELKFGLTVTGMVHPDRVLRNSTARPGDILILTKPVGTGILSSGLKTGVTDPAAGRKMIDSMLTLNRKAAEIMLKYPVHACTDVTGFGLLGHLREMVLGSGTGAEIGLENVPVFPGVWELIASGVIPGGTRNNLRFVGDVIHFSEGIGENGMLLLADAQTSGGLLISIPCNEGRLLLQEYHDSGIRAARIIGQINADRGKIKVVQKFSI